MVNCQVAHNCEITREPHSIDGVLLALPTMNAGPGNRLLSEKNIGQIAGATGVWLTAPWIARMTFGVVFVIAAAVLIFR